MKSLTNEEYLALCQKLVEEQYDHAIDDYDIEKMEWIPAESEAKKKMVQANTNGIIDLTNVKSSEIKKQLLLCTNFRIGTFKVRIDRYQELPIDNNAVMTMSLTVWEEKKTTPSGLPCKMDQAANIEKDNSFTNRPWLKYFKGYGNSAHHVPIDTVADIFRWMQAVKKLSAFL